MFDECLGVVNAVPEEQGVCVGCLKDGFYCLRVFWGCWTVLGRLRGGVWYYFTFNFLKFQEVTNQILDILKLT